MTQSVQHPLHRLNRLSTTLRWAGSLLLICTLSVFGGSAWADGGHGYGHDAKSKLEKLTEKLSLTPEQQAKILPIIEEKHQKMEALHGQMKEMRQQAMGKIEAELTPEQKEKWKEMQEKRAAKMKEYKEKHGKKCDKKGKHDKDKHDD